METKDLTKEKILSILRERKDILEKYKVKRIGLFGSYANNKADKDSDIDLIIDFELSSFGKNFDGLFEIYMELSSFLENLFGKPVDILTPASIEGIRIK
ncbi:MAG: nucleotidyltransferase, partial [Candidatus Cloacimonadota bacterium]